MADASRDVRVCELSCRALATPTGPYGYWTPGLDEVEDSDDIVFKFLAARVRVQRFRAEAAMNR